MPLGLGWRPDRTGPEGGGRGVSDDGGDLDDAALASDLGPSGEGEERQRGAQPATRDHATARKVVPEAAGDPLGTGSGACGATLVIGGRIAEMVWRRDSEIGRRR